MGNLILNVGSLGSLIVLFICAAYLHSQGHQEWTKFFNVGVFFGTWGALWTICYYGVQHYLSVRIREYRGSSSDVVTAYAVSLLVCALGTLFGGVLILRFV